MTRDDSSKLSPLSSSRQKKSPSKLLSSTILSFLSINILIVCTTQFLNCHTLTPFNTDDEAISPISLERKNERNTLHVDQWRGARIKKGANIRLSFSAEDEGHRQSHERQQRNTRQDEQGGKLTFETRLKSRDKSPAPFDAVTEDSEIGDGQRRHFMKVRSVIDSLKDASPSAKLLLRVATNTSEEHFAFNNDIYNKDIYNSDVYSYTYHDGKNDSGNENDDIQRNDLCMKFNLTYASPQKPSTGRGGGGQSRRIFFGSLLADDSWQTLASLALETRDIFHTMVFVESNRTQMFDGRKLRFIETDKRNGIYDSNGNNRGGSSGSNAHIQNNRWMLERSQMFGRHTNVTILQYINETYELYELEREHSQRSLILRQWKEAGMTSNDIGYISDVDEILRRDFLFAMMICDVPQFHSGTNHDEEADQVGLAGKDRRGGQEGHGNCKEPKVVSVGVIFEGSPMCVRKGKRWFHPDLIIGECIEGIGNPIHRPIARRYSPHGRRLPGYTSTESYSALQLNSNSTMKTNETRQHQPLSLYPLWNAADFRGTPGGKQYLSVKPNVIYTGYHLHNFFESYDTLRWKYKTYAHSVPGALRRPLMEIHKDVEWMVKCSLRGNMDEYDVNNIYTYVGGGNVTIAHVEAPNETKSVLNIDKDDNNNNNPNTNNKKNNPNLNPNATEMMLLGNIFLKNGIYDLHNDIVPIAFRIDEYVQARRQEMRIMSQQKLEDSL